jgi:hypothetical protein
MSIDRNLTSNKPNKFALISFILGFINFIIPIIIFTKPSFFTSWLSWSGLIPILLFLSCIIFGGRGLESKRRILATIGISLGIGGLICWVFILG